MTELWGAYPRCGKNIIMELSKENQELKRENKYLKTKIEALYYYIDNFNNMDLELSIGDKNDD